MTPRTAQGPVANRIASWFAGGTVGRSTVNLVNLGKAVEEQSAIGDSAVKADVPSDIAVENYLPWLESFGPVPTLSLYSASLAAHPRAGEWVETEQERRTVLACGQYSMPTPTGQCWVRGRR